MIQKDTTYSLVSKGLKIRYVQSEIKCDTHITGQFVEMLIYVLFSPISHLLLELPETSLLSCLSKGSVEERGGCGPGTGQPCLRTKVIGDEITPSELVKLSDERLVLTIFIEHHLKAGYFISVTSLLL